MEKNTKQMSKAFYDLTLALLCIFQVHKADSNLIQCTTKELEQIFNRYLDRINSKHSQAKLAMEHLLDELEVIKNE